MFAGVAPRALIALAMATALGPTTPAQDAAAWRARLDAGTEAAVRVLGELPATFDAEFAAPIARLLQSPDANLRNHAAAWLRNRPQLADQALPVLAELRASDDPEVARAAGSAFAALAPHRSLSLDDLREQLRDDSRRQHAIQRLASLPDAELALLPELLDTNPIGNADAALQRVQARAPQRLRADLLAALDRAGDTAGRIRWLEKLGPVDAELLAMIDAQIPSDPYHGRDAAIEVATRAVASGALPPAHWLDVLRRDDGANGRQVLLRELTRHPIPSRLWPEIAPRLREADYCASRMLLDFGRLAKDHTEELRAAMDRGGVQVAAVLGPVAAELAPVTRDCAPALLPCLRVDHRDTVLSALHCLGALGNDSAAVLDAIAACLDHADETVRLDALVALGRLRATAHRAIAGKAEGTGPPFAALADFVVTAATAAVPADALFAAATGTDLRRALVAAHALAAHRVASTRLVQFLLAPVPSDVNDWWTSSMRRHLTSTLVCRLTEGPLDHETARAAMTLSYRLPVQDAVRVLDWLAQGGPVGTEMLAERLCGDGTERHVLEAIGARGRDLAALAPIVAPFVHHPQLVVREAATECLASIADAGTVAAARLQPDPWPRWLRLRDKYSETLALAFVVDATAPTSLRVRALAQINQMHQGAWPGGYRQLLGLLRDRDEGLSNAAMLACVRHADLFLLPQRTAERREVDPVVLDAFAGGPRAVRLGLGALLRCHLGVAWPAHLVQQVLDRADAASGMSPDGTFFADQRSLTQRALEQLRDHEDTLPIPWLQALAARQPALAITVLAQQSAAAPLDLLPALVDPLVANSPASTRLCEILMRSEAGRRHLLQHGANLPIERRMSIVTDLGGDLRPYREHLEDQLQQAIARGEAPTATTIAALASLPWADPGTDLARIARLTEQLWQAKLPGRQPLLRLLQALGPAAAFAADDLVAMLRQDLPGEHAAMTLLAIGERPLVDAWLLSKTELRRLDGDALLQAAWATVHAGQVLEATDAELPARWARFSSRQTHLRPEQRAAIALRLLAHAEASGLGSPMPFPDLAGDLGTVAHAEFAAFFARRKTLANRPDPLAEAVATQLLPVLPDLATQAMRDGLARASTVLAEARAGPIEKHRIAGLAADLVQIVVESPERVSVSASLRLPAGYADPHLGTYVGRLLARAGVAPLDTILPLLDDAFTRTFALSLLGALGAHAALAVDAVERIATDHDDQALRLFAAQTLACLGPLGAHRLGALVAANPELLPILLTVLRDGDEDSAAAAADSLIQLRWQPDPKMAGELRQRLQRCTDAKAKSLLTLLLLEIDPHCSDQQWLAVIDLQPAVIRQRAVQTLGKHARGALQLGVIAELLDDADDSVQRAALEVLLASPVRVTTCRAPLEQFLGTADAEQAARIRDALARPR